MTYVVAGVSGNTGSVVADTLLSAGEKVRVVVRTPEKGEVWARKGAEVAIADLGDRRSLARALTGARGAWLLVPPNFAVPDFRAYQRATADVLFEAARDAELPHLVLLSSIGAQHGEGTGPIAALHYAEQRLSALPRTRSTFVRAGYFIENFATAFGTLDQGVLGSFLPAALPIPMIATVDIGRVAAAALREGASATRIIELGGPAHTTEHVAAVISRILERPIRVAEAGLEAVVPALTSAGMSEDMAGLYREMLGALAAGIVAFEGGHRRLEGSTPIEQVLSGLLARA